MATLVFGAIGTALGGPFGGAIGALLGRQVDQAIIGSGRISGPRLKELNSTSSSYGEAIPRHFGRMRVPGSIIWATDLVEHSETDGGGKSRPSVTSFTYSASFAVALSSRPIHDIGRIWADGSLLRGVEGDLKATGTMRIYRGYGDQEPDETIAEIEGAALTPAYRGLAYVVFQDLDLGNYFNRIPSLTFEVIADDGTISLQQMTDGLIEHADARLPLDELAGFSLEGPLSDALEMLDPMYPMDTDGTGEVLMIARERLQQGPVLLAEPAVAVDDDAFGGATGYARKRAQPPTRAPEILRYYDLERDYLPGVQRAPGRPAPGQPRTIELPAAVTAANARLLAGRIAQRAYWGRDQVAWRTTELDPSVAPGALVTLPGQVGRWRVKDWEWRASGVELTLLRVTPTGLDRPVSSPVDAGRANPAPDLTAPPTVLHAFELPWNGTGPADAPVMRAAVSSPQSHWAGAALYADHGTGDLLPLGPSGRSRAVMGTALSSLPPASPHLFDRASSLIVQLIDPVMELAGSNGRFLAQGANQALVGDEMIQFAEAVALGGGTWKLGKLLRGRGGTEFAISGHAAGEPFVLLGSGLVTLDPAAVGSASETTIIATSAGDPEPVEAAIALRGITLRPLAPVHQRYQSMPGGALELCWTRRARGGWLWLDAVDTPLNEQAHLFRVTFGNPAAPLRSWTVADTRLELSPAELTELSALQSAAPLFVQQLGTHAASVPLFLCTLP